MTKNLAQQIENIKGMIDDVLKDRGIPKNIRTTIEEVKAKISSEKPTSEEFSSAIYSLDDISNNINMPAYTRTSIWEIISEMERLKEELK
jgi:uncharacterized protein (UPF0147 family)